MSCAFFKLPEEQNEAQRILRLAACKLQGEYPCGRKSRSALVQAHESLLLSKESQDELPITSNEINEEMPIHYFPMHYLPSSALLADLRKVMIKDLVIETHHRGSFTLLRNITRPFLLSTSTTIMEDESGDAITVQLYHNEPKKIIDGALCVIREPYLKVLTARLGDYAISVDHINDIFWLSSTDELVPLEWQLGMKSQVQTVDDWKQKGNAAMGVGDFQDAIEKYSEALRCNPNKDEARTIMINRSLAKLSLGCYDGALLDATHTSPQPEKALYRAAQALYELGRFKECRSKLERLLQIYPKNQVAKGEIRKVQARLNEQLRGQYNFESMYNTLENPKNSPCLDCATYIGPVEIRNSQGKGAGLFTTRKVEAGELLLCEKAFAFSPGLQDTHDTFFRVVVDLFDERVTGGPQEALIAMIARKLKLNPSLVPAFESLYHGFSSSNRWAWTGGLPAIDTFSIASVIKFNSFAIPRTSKEQYLRFLQCDSSSDIDMDPEEEFLSTASGIWIMACHINHACDSNVQSSWIGDMHIVRASRNIPSDTEITLSYVSPDQGDTTTTNNNNIFSTWSFTCNCPICLDQSTTPPQTLQKRKALDRDWSQRPEGWTLLQWATKLEELLPGIEQTYTKPPTEVPRIHLDPVYHLLAQIHVLAQNKSKAIAFSLRALTSLGFVIKDTKDTSAPSPPPPTTTKTITKNPPPPPPPQPPFTLTQWGLMTPHVVALWVYLSRGYDLCFGAGNEWSKRALGYAKVSYGICVGEEGSFGEALESLLEVEEEVGLRGLV
ncbi:MAG: hypothetical protein M1834_009065 [Cirrosporium novae-zelandiae]|nr:MAG: hypothetical protein M1834_009065 [Cirrosporium novae-zelandiae]